MTTQITCTWSVHNPPWKVNHHSAIQEIPCLLQNLKFFLMCYLTTLSTAEIMWHQLLMNEHGALV
jgi:hypothetical protein